MSEGMTELGMVTDYPEHDKLHAVNERSQAVGQFLEWLSEGFVICQWSKEIMEDKPCSQCDPDAVRHLCYFCCGTGTEPTCVRRAGFYPAGKPIQEWLAEHFKIDQAKLEKEKLAMLDIVRKAYDASA